VSSKIILLTSLIVLTGILGLSAFDLQQAFAASSVISDDATGGDCITLGDMWDDGANTCTFTNDVSIGAEDLLTIDENVTVVFQGGVEFFNVNLFNEGTLTNNGTIKFVGGAGNFSGSLNNSDFSGTVNNNGTMEFVGGAGVNSGSLNNEDGTVNNNGTMSLSLEPVMAAEKLVTTLAPSTTLVMQPLLEQLLEIQ
jgi:hypothetical protein